MKADGISTLNIQTAMQSSVRRTQLALLRAQNEYATGRYDDVGLSLGRSISTNLGLRSQISAYENLKTIHGVAAAKAELTQSGLEQLKNIANTFVSTLSGARTAQNGQALAQEAAQSAYASILEVLGTAYDGQPIFAGINSGNPVLTGYAGSAAESAVDTAFASTFGFPSDSPSAIGITPSQLQNYLNTVFAPQFEDPNWNANWSGASSVTPLTSLEDGVRVNLSASANSEAIRELVKTVVSVMSTATGELNASTFGQLADTAMAGASTAIVGITGEQTRIGIGQEALKKSTEKISQKSDLLKARVQESESVDQYEAAMRMNQLMTQLEASYAITAKISKLSLANYL